MKINRITGHLPKKETHTTRIYLEVNNHTEECLTCCTATLPAAVTQVKTRTGWTANAFSYIHTKPRRFIIQWKKWGREMEHSWGWGSPLLAAEKARKQSVTLPSHPTFQGKILHPRQYDPPRTKKGMYFPLKGQTMGMVVVWVSLWKWYKTNSPHHVSKTTAFS